MAVQDSILPTGGGKDGKSPVFVSAGTTVAFSSIALQRRKDLWGEDAEEFRPERWEHEKSGWVRIARHWHSSPSNNACLLQKFIPFSGGPRKCIGRK